MTKDFTDCIKNGGRVITKKLKNGRQIKICYDKEGNSHGAEIYTKKKEAKTAEKVKIDIKSLQELQDFINNNFHI